MKILVLALCLFATAVSAQQPQPQQRPGPPPPGQALPENYVLTLSVLDKGQVITELSLVVATTDFNASLPDGKPAINAFNGTIVLEDGGSVLVRYTLNLEILLRPNGPNPQTKSSVAQSSARLRLGEAVQILHTEARTCRLSIAKLADQPSNAR